VPREREHRELIAVVRGMRFAERGTHSSNGISAYQQDALD
jgi:hypothetical protein